MYKMRVFTEKTAKAKKWKTYFTKKKNNASNKVYFFLSNVIGLKRTKLEIEFLSSCFFQSSKEKFLVKNAFK